MIVIGFIALLICLPIAGIAMAWLQLDAAAIAAMWQQAQTVLPLYLSTSAWLALLVSVGVLVVGAATATVIGMFEFRGKRFWSWVLLLPMAMPAYVSAYAYTDFLQYGGALQSSVRALFPQFRVDVRGLGGAVFLFVFTLYPYAYLLARNALRERGAHLLEAARLLGAPLSERIVRIALPLARPALVAGAALALMETLADYGVSAYFGLSTFTSAIYKAWMVLDDRIAAAQYATLLLFFVGVLLWLERRQQQRMRFATVRGNRGNHGGGSEPGLTQLHGMATACAWLICALPVLLGFVVPVAILLQLLWSEHQQHLAGTIDLTRYVGWAWNSFRFAAVAALLAVMLALLLGFAQRVRDLPPLRMLLLRLVARVAAMGYALPGSVVAVGILLPLGWLQSNFPGTAAGGWLTATAFGVIYAYLVRFTAVAVQSVEAGYTRIPLSFDEAARTMGTTRRAIVQKLHMPLLWRSLATAGLLVFVDVVKELPATLLLRPFNTDTLAVIAHNLARDERLGEAALPALSIVAVGLIPVVLVTRALNKR